MTIHRELHQVGREKGKFNLHVLEFNDLHMDFFVSRVGNLGCSSGVITKVGNYYTEDKGLRIGWNWMMMRQVNMWQHIDFGCDREPQV